MKYKILFLLSIFFIQICLAHNPREAFFAIKNTQNKVEITAEFPWTLRNSLIAFSPNLKSAKSQQKFEAVFVEYIKNNLILTDKDGNNMPFKSFKEIKNDGHSHGNIYLLIFEGKNLSEIKNTIMFDISDDQKNYHSLMNQKSNLQMETSPKQPSFELENAHSFSYWWFFLILIPLSSVLFKYLNKGNENT